MKSSAGVTAEVARRLERTWHVDVSTGVSSWPHRIPLGAPSKADLERRFATVQADVLVWRRWAKENGVQLDFAVRLVHGTTQRLPTHAIVPDLATAAAVAGPGWPQRLERGRVRAEVLADRFPGARDLPRAVRDVDGYTDADFDILVRVATWFTNSDATGKTPRQVPIVGVHAKWLNTHQPVIKNLICRDSLGLLPRHPPRIHFTYLDPDHLAAGRRRFDSATAADAMTPAYPPRLVLISENKDTAVHFPELTGGIAVEGDGFGADTAAAFPWLVGAPVLLYWGDMDPSGLEIVNGYRRSGVPVCTILMDVATYDSFERFGTDTDKNGRPLGIPDRKDLPLLTDTERELYDRLTAADWTGHRRVEQERIPLPIALAAVAALSVTT